MDLGTTLADSGNRNILLTSLIQKVVGDIFMQEKDIDVIPYIKSISIIEDVVLIKTSNPMMNAELLLLDDKIIDACIGVLSNMGIDTNMLKIRYI